MDYGQNIVIQQEKDFIGLAVQEGREFRTVIRLSASEADSLAAELRQAIIRMRQVEGN